MPVDPTPAVIQRPWLAPSAGAAAPFAGGVLARAATTGDLVHGGPGRIAGTVKQAAEPTNTPLRRRVRLHRELDGLLIRETWSNAATGAYEFTYIDPAYVYTVLSHDWAREHRAVVADNLTPEVPTP